LAKNFILVSATFKVAYIALIALDKEILAEKEAPDQQHISLAIGG